MSTTTGAPSSETGAVVLNYWREFDLESQRAKLDENALKIAENQEYAMKNRRKLMELTRDFKKAPKEEKEDKFMPLLKSFQEEVDNVTKRAKFAENAFLSVFQQLYDAPDPVAVLVHTLEASARGHELEQVNRKLSQELEEFQAESGKLKNQQVTVRRLEERNRLLEQQLESKAQDLITSKEKELEEESQRTLLILKQREQFLLSQLESANAAMTTMRKEHDEAHNQIFAIKAQHEEERAARGAELDILQTEQEANEHRIQALEREREKLLEQCQLAQEAASRVGASQADLDQARAEVQQQEETIWELQRAAQALEASVAAARDEAQASAEEARRQVDEANAHASQLASELASCPSAAQLEELKRQISALKAVGYDWDGELSNESDGDANDFLEGVLVKKNRALEHEATTLKRQLQEAVALNREAEAREVRHELKVQELQSLIKQLEDDLAQRSRHLADTRRDAWNDDDCGTWDEEADSQEALLTKAASGDVESGKFSTSTQSARSAGGARAEHSDSSMVKVLAGQRDRFKARAVELEEAVRQMRQQEQRWVAELEQLKADNLALYERIKYVQDYQGEGDQTAAREAMRKYGRQYEENINPFTEFSRREKDRGFKDMRMYERITLSGSRFLLANKYTRAGLFVYTLALHSLVFIVLWKMSLHSVNTSMLPTEELCSRQRLLSSAISVFKHADADHNGVLDAHEFEHALEEEANIA